MKGRMFDERPTPRISMNKLAEYMTAHPLRRRQIVEQQKRPDTFRVARYRRAREAIVHQLATNPHGVGALEASIQALEAAEPLTEWQEQDGELSIEALQAFADIDHGLEPAWALTPAGMSPKLLVAGVEVSVQPDLLIAGADRKGRPFSGLVKLHFSKRNGLDALAGEYAAALLQHWASLHLATEGVPLNRKHCVVIDVLSGHCFRPPKSTARRLNHLTVACEEVALRWGCA